MEVVIPPVARPSTRAAVARFLLAVEAASTTPALAPIVPSTMTPATMHMLSLTTTALVGTSIVDNRRECIDNAVAGGYTPADEVDYTCGNADITLTLCPGTTSDYT